MRREGNGFQSGRGKSLMNLLGRGYSSSPDVQSKSQATLGSHRQFIRSTWREKKAEIIMHNVPTFFTDFVFVFVVRLF